MTRTKKDQDTPAARDGQGGAQLSADLQAHIGVRLKAFYDSVLSEPIPDRFAELLNRLDGSEGSTSASSASPGDGAAASDQPSSAPAEKGVAR